MVGLGHSLSLGGEKALSQLGGSIENFELRNLYGKTHHLTDYADRQLIVIVFVGNDCPLVKLYAARLAELAGEFGPRGVVFLGINSNRQDTLTEIAAFARQAKLEFPLLKDPDNNVADRFGAQRTPEAFVLDRESRVRIGEGSTINLASAIGAIMPRDAIWRWPLTSCLPVSP